MGRFDEDPRNKSLNEKIEKGIIKANNFMMNPPNIILRYIFYFLTIPSRLVHQNGVCSKFVQKHMLIITPLHYAMVSILIIFSMIFIPSMFIDSLETKIIFYISLYIVMLFFGMATFRGGGRRKDKPPTDNSDERVPLNFGV